MPEPEKVNPHQALTFKYAAFVLSKLPERLSLMSTLSICDTLNVAELTALRWRRINLTNEIHSTDGLHLPPKSLLVWENYSKGEIRVNKAKTKSRRRILPIPDTLRLGKFSGASGSLRASVYFGVEACTTRFRCVHRCVHACSRRAGRVYNS